MPIIENCNFQFMYNNEFENGYSSLTVDSEQAGYPLSNAFDTDLYKQWKIESFFKIDSTNNKLYIDALTATIDEDSYTGDELATEIQAKLNSVSSGYTVTYSATTWKFTITNSGSVSLILSNQTNAAWFTIGFSSITDQTGTSFIANEQRNHYPSVQLTVDFGYNPSIGFVSLMSPLGSPFNISPSATITVEGDNLNFLSTSALTKTMSVTDNGAFLVLNDIESSYRYWRITIEDIYNISGPEIAIGYLYLGYASQTSSENISTGLDYSLIDNSTISVAENGSYYLDEKTKTNRFGNVNIPLARKTTRDIIYDLFNTVGKTRPFIISIDPKTQITSSIKDFTKLVRFSSDPIFKNIKYDIFDISFTLEEVI